MTIQEKAVAQLLDTDFQAKIENDTVYLCIGDSEFELAEHEIKFQATRYDENNEITSEQILAWHGSDHSMEELAECMAEILNGTYALETARKEIGGYGS